MEAGIGVSAIQELHHSINKVLLQKTFQLTLPLINAVFELMNLPEI